MKPVMQTVPHDPERGLYGDCFRACVASLLDMPAASVPHFIDGPHPTKWYEDCNAWLAQFDLFLVWFQNSMPEHITTHAILSGSSPRHANTDHCVVGFAGKIVHDPAGGAGLAGAATEYGLLVKRCDLREPNPPDPRQVA